MQSQSVVINSRIVLMYMSGNWVWRFVDEAGQKQYSRANQPEAKKFYDRLVREGKV